MQPDFSFSDKEKKLNLTYNKENVKKVGLETSMELKRSFVDLHEPLKTPKGRMSMTNLASPFRAPLGKKSVNLTATKASD